MVFWLKEKIQFQFSTDWRKGTSRILQKCSRFPRNYASNLLFREMDGHSILVFESWQLFLRKVLKPNLWWQLRDQKWSPNNSGMKKHLSRKGKGPLHSFFLGYFFPSESTKKGQWNLVLSSQRNSWSNYKIATFYHFYSYVKCSNAVSNLR